MPTKARCNARAVLLEMVCHARSRSLAWEWVPLTTLQISEGRHAMQRAGIDKGRAGAMQGQGIILDLL